MGIEYEVKMFQKRFDKSKIRTHSSCLVVSTRSSARSRSRNYGIPLQVVIFLLLCHFITGLPLNEFIRHFEPAHFSTKELAESHRVAKRSLENHNVAKRSIGSETTRYQTPVRFNLTAHNRLFLITLQNSAQDIFSSDVVFENTDGPIPFTAEKIYSGFLEDSPKSSVHGIVTDEGLFDGHISTQDVVYYIEPAHRYFANGSQDFHSVIYKTSDVIHPSDFSDCKSHELHLKHREWSKVNRNDVCAQTTDTYEKSFKATNSTKHFQRQKRDSEMSDQMFEAVSPDLTSSGPNSARKRVTTYEIVDWDDVPESVRHHFRKRAKAMNTIDAKKRTCMLYLQADHLFYENMGSEEACIESMTRHVQRVNSIYKPIDFDQDGVADNISFMIKRIKVHTSDALKDQTYRFPGNYGVEKFLEIFSEENYDAFCLAYMFTYRDFEGGTLGLAWTGDLKNAGGVCEKNGHYRGSLKSLNTGIITFLNYGKHVPPAVSHVTMAHEMGHNFGSPHDPENNKACVPGGEDGNYIMYARATSGDKKNNRKFSPCSLKSIKPVLLAKARGAKGCFKEPQTALCGNGVVEEGEECDCGWEEDCQEDCCWPQRNEFAPGEKPCTLKPNRVCSPTQGPCCTNDCIFTKGDKCRDDNGCQGESYCDGMGPQCPSSELKPNRTICHDEFVCYKGECTGSICLAYGLESCQCSQGPDDPATKPCELCCKEPGDDKPCMSSFQLNEPPWDVPDMYSKPGTPCNNYKGYCDVFQKCRQIDPSGPLATLHKLLLSEESLAALKKFLTHYWYTVIFIGMGVLLLMGLIIKFCGKKTPLVHRRHRKHRRTVQHHDTEDQPQIDGEDTTVQVHPAIVELSLPFGKKVRLGERKKKSDQQSAKHSSSRMFESVARATRLAENLGQRIANIPVSEGNTPLASEGNSSPEKDRRQSRPAVKAHSKRRPFKSLSPEKRLIAKGLAESVSRSFEKLDLVSPRRIVNAKRRKTSDIENCRSLSADAENKRKRRKDRSGKESSKTPPAGKEISIPKLGKFTISLEVASSGSKKVSDVNSREREEKRKRRERRKKINDEQKQKKSTSNQKEQETKEEEDKVESEPTKARKTSQVVVSKRQKSDRPLRASVSPEKGTDDDYRATFSRRRKVSQDPFSRSVSHPGQGETGPDPDSIEGGMKRNNSFSGDKNPRENVASKLKRSETEKSSGLEWGKRLGGGNSAALLLSPKPAFENRAYDKSPEPTTSETKSGSFGYLKVPEETRQRTSLLSIKSSSLDTPVSKKSLNDICVEFDSDSSSNSLSKRLTPQTQIQSLSEDSTNGDDHHCVEDSSDSEMEMISRSKIIDRVKQSSLPEASSRALLLASSHSLVSDAESPKEETSNVEFIFPSEECSTKSPQQTSMSSLSERYSRKNSSSCSSVSSKTSDRKISNTKKKSKTQDLDNISIMTDGMG